MDAKFYPATTNPSSTTTKIQVALEIDGNHPLEKQQWKLNALNMPMVK